MVCKCVTIIKKRCFSLFPQLRILATFWYPFWKPCAAGCVSGDPLGPLWVPGELLWGRHVAFLCMLGHLSGSLSVPLGARGVRKGVSAHFLVDVLGCFPMVLDFQRHPHPSPRSKKSGIQDSNNLRFKYAVGPRFQDSVKHIFEDSWHAKVCEASLPSVSETC